MKNVVVLIIVGVIVAAFGAGAWWAGNLYFANSMSIHELAAPGEPHELEYVLKWCPHRANERDRFGRVPLHAAAVRPSSAAVEVLLESGAKPNAMDRTSRTPLHLAVAKGRPAAVRLLLNSGAEPNAIDADGWTPLHIASVHDRAAVAQLLIDEGAMVNVQDKAGDTPLDWALMLFVQEQAAATLRRCQGKTRFELEREALIR